MKFSEAWLREWVDPPVSTQALAEQLTMLGHEVKALEPAAPPFHGVIVGEVLEVASHPNADKLSVCRVHPGQGDAVEVVCGASNVVPGMRAPLAVVGAVLPGELKIKRSKLRGVVSQGMLCSARELGLGDDASGIVSLPADAEPGRDLREYLALDDTVLDLGLTANRGDCLSVAGIARELAAANDLPCRPMVGEPVEPRVGDALPIVLDAPAACPVYAGRAIRGLNPGAVTPAWMQERLRRCGLRPLHPVVDVTNYVMLESGQPMHAFDLGRLTGGITVRYAREGERLRLLDGREVTLSPDVLVIADDQGASALAGIMGGEASAVTEATESIFFESAFFAPAALAGRGRRLGLQTDALHRFERGVDPQGQVRAIERATQLLMDIAGGEPGPVCHAREVDALPTRTPIRLRRQRITRVLGTPVPDTLVEGVLRRLELELETTGEGWRVRPPGFRFDLELEEDLIEEVGRFHGYENIPETLERADVRPQPCPETRLSTSRVKTALADRGYREAVTYSFVEPSYQASFAPEVTPLALANPISNDMSVMRVSLWPGLVSALTYNLRRQRSRVRLFEMGLRYTLETNEKKEEKLLSGLAAGQVYPEQWGTDKREVDFFDVRADVEAVLRLGGRRETVQFEPAEHHCLHPAQSARIRVNGADAGWLGALHPRLARELDIPVPVYLFELLSDVVLEADLPAFEPVSKFPSIRRDIAVVVDEAVSAAQLRGVAEAGAPKLLQELRIFDVYRGKGVDLGRKSVALGLILQDSSRNLTDGDADRVTRAVVAKLEQELGAKIRD